MLSRPYDKFKKSVSVSMSYDELKQTSGEAELTYEFENFSKLYQIRFNKQATAKHISTESPLQQRRLQQSFNLSVQNYKNLSGWQNKQLQTATNFHGNLSDPKISVGSQHENRIRCESLTNQQVLHESRNPEKKQESCEPSAQPPSNTQYLGMRTDSSQEYIKYINLRNRSKTQLDNYAIHHRTSEDLPVAKDTKDTKFFEDKASLQFDHNYK